MNSTDMETLTALASFILKNKITINSIVSTQNYDYEIVTYFDEVVVLDTDETILISVRKEDVEKEKQV